jgi:hypothetical protein
MTSMPRASSRESSLVRERHLRQAAGAYQRHRARAISRGIADGRRLAFTALLFEYEPVEIGFDGSVARGNTVSGARWAPGGTQYAYVAGNQIRLRDANCGWERHLITERSFEDETRWLGDLVFSPEGQRIAFSRAGASGLGVWVAALSGGVAVRMAAGARHPSFSPDGVTLAYSLPGTGVAKGDQAAAVTRDGGTHPRWSPDGDRIGIHL